VSVVVALLSAVNTGRRKATSDDLRAIVAGLGWRGETLLASGNIIADIGRASLATAGRKLEAAVADKLGFDCTAIMRTGDDLDGVIARQPYGTFTPKLMLTVFLSAAPTKAAIAALAAFNDGREDFVVDGREMYVRHPSAVAETRLTPSVLRRTLGVVGTARNWNTVRKLRDRARAMEAG
jgi:uncharacterized protein (DUF1697 family)